MGKLDNITHLYEQIMIELGIEQNDDNVLTPKRVARSLMEMTHSVDRPIEELDEKMTTFPAKTNTEVIVESIPFSSICAHHHLPFTGKAEIKYDTGASMLGLSKFARVVEFFSKMPQTQENMTNDIALYLAKVLNPLSLTVRLYDVEHTCMTVRGVKATGAKTTTKYEYNVGDRV